MSQLTVGWTRAENAADLPQDSGVVFPGKMLTVGWKPMLNSAVLDWDAEDLLVPPGAGPDKEPPIDRPATPPPHSNAGGNGVGAGPGAPPAAATKPDPPGAPDVRVTTRRTMSLFRPLRPGCRAGSYLHHCGGHRRVSAHPDHRRDDAAA